MINELKALVTRSVEDDLPCQEVAENLNDIYTSHGRNDFTSARFHFEGIRDDVVSHLLCEEMLYAVSPMPELKEFEENSAVARMYLATLSNQVRSHDAFVDKLKSEFGSTYDYLEKKMLYSDKHAVDRLFKQLLIIEEDSVKAYERLTHHYASEYSESRYKEQIMEFVEQCRSKALV